MSEGNVFGQPDPNQDVKRAYRMSVQDLADERERLISERNYLISQGVHPDELEPIDGYEATKVAHEAHPLLKVEPNFDPVPSSMPEVDAMVAEKGIEAMEKAVRIGVDLATPGGDKTAEYVWDGDPKGKDSNPKDAIGSRKAGLSMLPRQVLYEVSLGMLEGALKYARHNYRIAGVRGSVYKDACDRHLDAWWEGQDFDPGSGLHHVAKAIASLVVLRDSMIAGNWYDDRPPSIGDPNWLTHMNKEAERIIDDFEGEPKQPFIRGDNI